MEKERMEEGEIEGRKEASESHMQKTTKHKSKWDFPENPVVKTPYLTAGDTVSIPGWGTKIPYAEQ